MSAKDFNVNIVYGKLAKSRQKSLRKSRSIAKVLGINKNIVNSLNTL